MADRTRKAVVVFDGVGWRDETGTHYADKGAVVDLPAGEFDRLAALGAVKQADGDGGEGEQAPEAEPPLDDMTVEQLEEIAAVLDIPGRSGMRKAELVEAIRAAQSAQE